MSILTRIIARILLELHKAKIEGARIESQVAAAMEKARDAASALARTVRESPFARRCLEETLDDEAEYRRAATGEDLTNWRSSIVDFCKLVRIDPSFNNRRDLARELDMDTYSGAGSENVELSKRLLAALRGD